MTSDDRLHERLAPFAGRTIGVACSAGADSVALVHLLVDVRAHVVVCHVDHGLRDGSIADAGFVESLARSLHVPFAVERVAVASGDSLEAAARDARYAALRRMAVQHGLAAIATAHTLDDQAETVLLRAMRGDGLAGIAPDLGLFVRPLLDVRRAQLRRFLIDRGIGWREDPSNADLAFERNWVRHVLLPQMRERRGGVDVTLARVAARTRHDDAVLDGLAATIFERARVDDAGILLDAADLAAAPVAIASRVIRAALHRLGARPRATDVERIRTMGRHHRTGHIDVWRLPDGMAFTVAAAIDDVVLVPDGEVDDPSRGLRVRVGDATAPPWRWRTLVDDASGLVIRRRAPGDRVRGSAGTRKVSDVLIDAKVPRPLRERVGIVASGDQALAVVGHLAGRVEDTSGRIAVDVEPTSTSWSKELVWSR